MVGLQIALLNGGTVFDSKNIQAIIGLGNPGTKYAKNRHSIGFRIVDELVQQCGSSWHDTDVMAHATITLMDHPVIVIKPQTFMNNSGRVVPWLQKKGIKPEQILVVHDELEKKFGQLAIRQGGSHRGHNGLRSLMEFMGPDFWRLRFGIGRPPDKDAVSEYVLSDFSKTEEEQIRGLIDQAIGLISSQSSNI
jgi:peptidyl-tRNA hydrolase, PTH1 family